MIFYIYAKVRVWSIFFNISSKSFFVIYLNFFSLMVDTFYKLSLWGVCNVHYIFEMKRLYFENLFYLSHKYWQNDFSSNVTLVIYSHLLLFLRVFSYYVAIGDLIGGGIVTHVIYYIMIIDSLTLATYIGYIWTVTINTRSIFDKFFQKKALTLRNIKFILSLRGIGSYDCKGIVLKLPRIHASVLSVFNASNTEEDIGHRRTCIIWSFFARRFELLTYFTKTSILDA